MNDDRELIFARVRNALAPLRERAPLPSYYDADISVTRTLISGHDRVENPSPARSCEDPVSYQ